MAFSPEAAKPLNALAEVLLRGPNTLTPAEREMIATYVSSQNGCHFCQSAHGAVAAYRLGGNERLIHDVKLNFESAAISEKLKSLLAIAGKVQKGGKQVTAENIARARQQGAPTKRFTTPCSSRRLSACSIATWMVWRLGRRRILKCIARTGSAWPRSGMSIRQMVCWRTCSGNTRLPQA
jgi:AhpD family alkylhydroperoxidase